jgi:hypothetical protein
MSQQPRSVRSADTSGLTGLQWGGYHNETNLGTDLSGELGDIAAIAIENARLTGDLRRTTREVAELNGRLSSELAERDAELVRVKADLPIATGCATATSASSAAHRRP